jgi:cytochrome b561
VPKLAAPGKALADNARDAHEWLFWVLVALVSLHVASALHHHLFRNDPTLSRMLPSRRRSPP